MIPIIGPIGAIFLRFFRAVRTGLDDPEFRGLFYAAASVVGSGTVLFKYAEGWGWIDSLYFTVITLTTVGYGDLSPTKPLTKVAVVVLVLLGIGLIIAVVERVARYATEDAVASRERRRTKRRNRRGGATD
jgi:voltage-gated potassium channel